MIGPVPNRPARITIVVQEQQEETVWRVTIDRDCHASRAKNILRGALKYLETVEEESPEDLNP